MTWASEEEDPNRTLIYKVSELHRGSFAGAGQKRAPPKATSWESFASF